jgi:Lon protease-like protein
MAQIPLFPLSSVLFPGGTLPLHIFEERYKAMINECINLSQPFGVVLIKSGFEVGAVAEPHEVGTTARITRVERLPLGRLNIVTVGARRFRIRSIDRSLAYLRAEVDYIPRSEGAQGETDRAAGTVAGLWSQYFRQTLTLSDQWTREVALPSRPAMLADFVAARLEAEPQVKQALLEAESVPDCLAMEEKILAEAVEALAQRVDAHQRTKYGAYEKLN